MAKSLKMPLPSIKSIRLEYYQKVESDNPDVHFDYPTPTNKRTMITNETRANAHKKPNNSRIRKSGRLAILQKERNVFIQIEELRRKMQRVLRGKQTGISIVDIQEQADEEAIVSLERLSRKDGKWKMTIKNIKDLMEKLMNEIYLQNKTATLIPDWKIEQMRINLQNKAKTPIPDWKIQLMKMKKNLKPQKSDGKEK